jgi:hypothetical protein
VVAFFVAYIICKAFKVNQGVSFAFAMLIGTIPDIDIVTQALGIMPHKTLTHSLIVSAGIGFAIFVIARLGFKQPSANALIYALAYVQHLMDDVVIGTLNILYPIGSLSVGIGISYGSVEHETIEFLLLAIAAGVSVSRSFDSSSMPGATANVPKIPPLFRFSMTDKISYILLIISLLFSFSYLLYEMDRLPRLNIATNLEMALFVLLHLSALAWASFMMLAAWQNSDAVKKSLISGEQQ